MALSIPKGAGAPDAQFNRHLQIALDCTRECVICFSVALRGKFISEEKDKIVKIQLTALLKMITRLQKRIKSRIKSNIKT
ncbi:hypothetical protein [Aquimarina celericrescens]|uniref:Four helix bundle protein n=1 Tax=Aquimarina celericrescens TaxID=1964542 RepID=A0ABW5B1L0_9FLAO